MNICHRVVVTLSTLMLCGCPSCTPYDHIRPGGHGDTKLAVSPVDDVIVFNSTGTGGSDLYLLHLTDQSVTRVAETPDYEVAPSVSPDGQWITYSAGVSGDRADHVFVMKIDGTSKTQLTNIDANDHMPRFSPDGKTIVFDRDKTYGWGGLAANWELGGVICAVDTDGTNFRQLTSDEVFAYAPHFRADGKSVIYSTMQGRMKIALDMSSAAVSVPGPLGAVQAPNGGVIAYAEGRYSPDMKIFIANTDGTSQRCLTPGMGYSVQPIFARHGDRLYFLREEWPNGPTGVPTFSLWNVYIDGTNPQQVAGPGLFDDPLNWKP